MTFNQPNINQKHLVTSAKVITDDPSPIGEQKKQIPSIHAQDYVNAVIRNEDDKILVLEGTDNGRSWASWQMIGRSIATDEDPILAIQQDLLLRTGYICQNWIYLGTFVIDETQKAGASHFFCGQIANVINHPDEALSDNLKLKWVSKRELKQAMVDGRIAVINHAAVASLAMLMCDHPD